MPQSFGSSTKMGKFESKYYQQDMVKKLECGQEDHWNKKEAKCNQKPKSMFQSMQFEVKQK